MKIIIHGGFFSESDTSAQVKIDKQNSLKEICNQGYQYLQNHSALETVVHVVSLLENDPLYNAGTGSQIQSDGKIRMSAALMDGHKLNMSGVINVENIQNPILLAKELSGQDDRFLSGEGANAFAIKHHFPYYNPEIPQRRAEYIEKKNNIPTSTVGCVCIDQNNRIAAATSTGGKGFEIPGRVSDSSTVAGNYANSFCGVSLTGVGEDIINGAMAAKIVTRVTDGMLIEVAFDKTFNELKQIDGFAGAIGIDHNGTIFHQESYPTMVYASFDGKNWDVFD